MDETEAKTLLFDYLYGELDEGRAEAFRRHLDACPACQKELASTRAFLQAYRKAPPPAPPSGASAAALEAARASGARPRPAVRSQQERRTRGESGARSASPPATAPVPARAPTSPSAQPVRTPRPARRRVLFHPAWSLAAVFVVVVAVLIVLPTLQERMQSDVRQAKQEESERTAATPPAAESAPAEASQPAEQALAERRAVDEEPAAGVLQDEEVERSRGRADAPRDAVRKEIGAPYGPVGGPAHDDRRARASREAMDEAAAFSGEPPAPAAGGGRQTKGGGTPEPDVKALKKTREGSRPRPRKSALEAERDAEAVQKDHAPPPEPAAEAPAVALPPKRTEFAAEAPAVPEAAALGRAEANRPEAPGKLAAAEARRGNLQAEREGATATDAGEGERKPDRARVREHVAPAKAGVDRGQTQAAADRLAEARIAYGEGRYAEGLALLRAKTKGAEEAKARSLAALVLEVRFLLALARWEEASEVIEAVRARDEAKAEALARILGQSRKAAAVEAEESRPEKKSRAMPFTSDRYEAQ